VPQRAVVGRVADAVAIVVFLTIVGVDDAVVTEVEDTVAVDVCIASIADAVAIEIGLEAVADTGTVVEVVEDAVVVIVGVFAIEPAIAIHVREAETHGGETVSNAADVAIGEVVAGATRMSSTPSYATRIWPASAPGCTTNSCSSARPFP
jgi:hypothetical protein